MISEYVYENPRFTSAKISFSFTFFVTDVPLGSVQILMSASEGGGGSWKSGHSKGGCMNFILQISSKWEGVKKPENIADVINGCSLGDIENMRTTHIP